MRESSDELHVTLNNDNGLVVDTSLILPKNGYSSLNGVVPRFCYINYIKMGTIPDIETISRSCKGFFFKKVIKLVSHKHIMIGKWSPINLITVIQ